VYTPPDDDEPFEPVIDVTEFFSIDELMDPTGLNLQIKKDVIKEVDSGGVWLVPFAFRSQIWHGNPWDHPSVLYVPFEINPSFAGTVAIIQQGSDDLDFGLNIDVGFGENVARELGVPVVVLAKVPHPTLFNEVESASLAAEFPSCFGGLLVEDGLHACGDSLTRSSEKFKWSVDLAMARAYMRAITALEGIPALLMEVEDLTLPSFQVERAVLGGAGKRVRALWLSAVSDSRVEGLWLAASDKANLSSFYKNMWDVWSGFFPFVAPSSELDFFQTDFGREWRSMADPYGYMESLEDLSVALVRGSNDGFSPLGSYARYADRLPANHGYQIVGNYGYGMASTQHTKSWKGLITQVGSGSSTFLTGIQIDAEQDGSTVHVTSNVPAGEDGVIVANLYYTATQVMTDDADMRDAVWSAVDLITDNVAGSTTYAGSFPTPLDHWATYLEIEYYDKNGSVQVVTSPPLLSWE